MTQLVAPFPWFGGKRTIASDVWKNFGEVRNYVEPFCGSAAMLLGAPEGKLLLHRLKQAVLRDGFGGGRSLGKLAACAGDDPAREKRQQLAAARLCSALTSREVPADLACAATLPMVAQRAYPAELLAAIAVGESRLQPGAVNTSSGAWGIGQCIGRRPRVLTAWAGVACQVRKLDGAADYCDRRGIGTPTCLLAGYASGPRGVEAYLIGKRWPRRRAAGADRAAARRCCCRSPRSPSRRR